MTTAAGSDLGRKLQIVRYSVLGGIASCFAIAPALWLEHPYFGCVPLFEGLPSIGYPLDWVLFVVMAGLLVPVILSRRPRCWILAWCIIFALRCVYDRITWQPFLLQYFFMLLLLARWSSDHGDAKQKGESALDGCRLIVAGIYFWSGVAKCNQSFLDNGMMVMFQGVFDQDTAVALHEFVIVIPVFELLLPVALLTGRFRRWAVVLALVMHACILAMLLGLGYNKIVWPWNVVMMVQVVVLFWGERGAFSGRVLTLSGGWTRGAVLALFVVCPGLSWGGLWPEYLSFRLYSSQYKLGSVLVDDGVVEKLPASARSMLQPTPLIDGRYRVVLPISHWSELELGAFAPPEEFVYRHVARRLCALVEKEDDIALIVESPPHWRTKERTRWLVRCSELE